VSEIIESLSGPVVVEVKGEAFLRDTEKSRTLIKATFVEVDRSIRTLSLTKFNDKRNPEDRTVISLKEDEVAELLEFAQRVKSANLTTPGKVAIQGGPSESPLTEMLAQELFARNPTLFAKIIEFAPLTEDVIAVGYRRKQLEKFRQILTSEEEFGLEQSRLQCGPESVWQRFFEASAWIFGYGLSYQFGSSLDKKKLEQLVRGSSILASGKRADAVLKTRGALSSLCFVEIKRHDTPLLDSDYYRKDSWQPSRHLTGGVAQVHATVQAAVEDIRGRFLPEDDRGDPTGEELFNIAPRSFLVVGSLNQFQTDKGVNASKFRSFELYRRHVWRPEIITFDELLERARFIVESSTPQ
jgi:hypothetical protein